MEDGSPCKSSSQRSRTGTPGSSPQQPRYDSGGSCLLRPLDGEGAPLASRLAGSSAHGLVRLGTNKVYTIGRRGKGGCDVGFCGGSGHRCVSRRHCQLFLDGSRRKLLLVDGFFWPFPSNLVETRRRFKPRFDPVGKQLCSGVRPSLNGTSVNGCRLRRGTVIELSVGDEVSFGCRKWLDHGYSVRYGFVVESVDILGASPVSDAGNLFAAETKSIRKTVVHMRLGHGEVLRRAVSLLTICRSIVESADPVKYIRESLELSSANKFSMAGISTQRNARGAVQAMGSEETLGAVNVTGPKGFQPCNASYDQPLFGRFTNDTTAKSCTKGSILPSDGKLLFLNRLEFTDTASSPHYNRVSLPELFHPIGGLKQVFIATFTSDIPWFLTYCGLPNHLPITIACHNAEKCWSASADKRTSMPYSDYPNLVLVYPPFPDSIAFGKDRKNRGVGCHHPKLIVLQREDTIRVIVTSANLVSRQWNKITNTVWWQDFPHRNTPDYLSLFTHISSNVRSEDSISDFAAQLAGFISSLIIDIPEQAYWIAELAKYDFGGAVGHLIASTPGLHMQDSSYSAEAEYRLTGKEIVSSQSSGTKLLGTVQTFVVGINHRFRTATDLNSMQLKTLASLLGNCCQSACGMMEVLLKRNTSIPADVNAVSIFVTNSDELSNGDYVQLGFLPRDIAKWVAPLIDAGFFHFSARLFPKEAMAAALGGTSTKVQLILYVSQGPSFSEIPSLFQSGHLAPLCSLLAHLQRCLGLWRLQEVLGRYRWPESLETDFVYGSSSVGTSVNPQFLAAFAAAAGKRSSEFCESEESDPEWGRWTTNHERKNASIRIIFPTIDRVNGSCGVESCRFLLSLSEKTWQRLRNSKIFHDSIPHPEDRVGYPMHVKVACRRFKSKTDPSSFGWIYCGSHNFSPAAWGRLIQYSSDANKSYPVVNSSLGQQLHICNYELGVLFIVPPPGTCKNSDGLKSNLDDTVLPFVMPAPKYQHSDRPATTQAMREVALLEAESFLASEVVEEMMDEEIPDEDEEMVEITDFITTEKEEEKIYAEMLWSQVDSTECR